MFTKNIFKILKAPFVTHAVTAGFLVCGGALSVWAINANSVAVEPLEDGGDTSTVPYVTDTEAFIAYLKDALTESGPQSVQSELKARYADAPYGDQHMSFHYFGEVLYEIGGASAFPLCENWYGFGCYHGFLLDAIDAEGYAVVPSLDAACVEKHGYSMETETCQHGIGHGLVEASGRDPYKALEGCDLVRDVYPKLGCASGVFMEYFSPTQSDARSRVSLAPSFDADAPFNVCATLTGTRLATCLFEIQSWWQDVGKLPAPKVEALCNTVEDTEAREFCLMGYGNFKGPYVSRALPYCEAFVEPESHALCRAGILWSAEHHYDRVEPLRACSDLEEPYRATCFQKGRFTCEVEKNCKLEGV